MPEVNTKTISIERLKRFLDDLPATSPLFPIMPPGYAWSSSDKAASTDRYNAPVAVTLANGGIRLVCGSTGSSPGGIIYSDDGGATWNNSDKTTGSWGTPTVYTYSGWTGLVCAGSGGIIYSGDRGTTWRVSNITSGVASSRTITAFTYNGATRLVGANLVYSDDGGATWTNPGVTGTWNTPTAFTWNGATRLVSGSIASYTTNNGLIYSDDGGITWSRGDVWTPAGEPNSFDYFSPVAFVYNDSTRLITFSKTYGSGFTYSDDGGATWRVSYTGVSGKRNVPTAFTWNGSTRLIASAINVGQVIYSDDGGITWAASDLVTRTWLPVTAFVYNNTTYLVTCDKYGYMGIVYSSDGGITWNRSTETTIRGDGAGAIIAFTFNNDIRLVFGSQMSCAGSV